MDPFFSVLQEIVNRRTFSWTHFTDRIYHHFSYFSGLAGYSKFTIILFPDVSNVQRSNRIIFFSGSFALFHHVGIRVNSRLFTSIPVGGEETPVFSYKICFVHCRKLPLSINRGSKYRIIWFQRTNIPF